MCKPGEPNTQSAGAKRCSFGIMKNSAALREKTRGPHKNKMSPRWCETICPMATFDGESYAATLTSGFGFQRGFSY